MQTRLVRTQQHRKVLVDQRSLNRSQNLPDLRHLRRDLAFVQVGGVVVWHPKGRSRVAVLAQARRQTRAAAVRQPLRLGQGAGPAFGQRLSFSVDAFGRLWVLGFLWLCLLWNPWPVRPPVAFQLKGNVLPVFTPENLGSKIAGVAFRCQVLLAPLLVGEVLLGFSQSLASTKDCEPTNLTS